MSRSIGSLVGGPFPAIVGWRTIWQILSLVRSSSNRILLFFGELAFGSVDARRAARLRIAVGLVIFSDLLFRLEDFYAFYDESGPLPKIYGLPWSAFVLSPSRAFTVGLYALLCVASLTYALGLATRVSGVVTYLLLHSLNDRNGLVLDGGDVLLTHFLLWMMFLDTGAALSLDVRWKLRAPKAHVWGFPLKLVQLQVCVVYAQSTYKKLATGWLHLDAVEASLKVDGFVRTTGLWLARQEWLCRILTAFTLVAEGAFGPLVWCGSRRARQLGLLMGASLHIGIHLVMRVGVFSPAIMAGYFAFWPDEDRTPPSRVPVSRWLSGSVLALFGACAVCIVLALKMPRVRNFVEYLGIEQRWFMFTPPPPPAESWRARGKLTDGRVVDVLAETIPKIKLEPAFFYTRWLKVRYGLRSTDKPQLFSFTGYICRRYNQSHRPLLKEFKLETASPWGEWREVVRQPCLRAPGP